MEQNDEYHFSFENVEENKEESIGGVNSYIKHNQTQDVWSIYRQNIAISVSQALILGLFERGDFLQTFCQ